MTSDQRLSPQKRADASAAIHDLIFRLQDREAPSRREIRQATDNLNIIADAWPRPPRISGHLMDLVVNLVSASIDVPSRDPAYPSLQQALVGYYERTESVAGLPRNTFKQGYIERSLLPRLGRAARHKFTEALNECAGDPLNTREQRQLFTAMANMVVRSTSRHLPADSKHAARHAAQLKRPKRPGAFPSLQDAADAFRRT